MLAAVDQFVKDRHDHQGPAAPGGIERDPARVPVPEPAAERLQVRAGQRAGNRARFGGATSATAWQFSIKDNGRGISPDRINAIFEPYVRGDNVGADEPGFGIGLNFCRTIIEWHHGKIWAESGPELGSTFKFTIPHHPT